MSQQNDVRREVAHSPGPLGPDPALESGPRVLPQNPSVLEAPVRLIDLLDSRSRRILAQSRRDLELPLQIIDLAGDPIVGQPVPSYVMDAAGPELGEVPGDETNTCWLVQQLLHEGDSLGVLAIGPLPVEQAQANHLIARHMIDLTDELLGAGLEKLLASRMHSASMASAYEQLQQKNQRLAAAVERLQQLDKVKSNFLATVSHELRTPLTSVIGYSEMLLEGLAGALNEEQSEYVRTVMEKGEQLLNIITGILDISRIEAGGVRLERAPCQLEELVNIAISTVAPTSRRKNVNVRKEIDAGLPLVYADRDKVRQVIINLLSNAVKFTPEGGDVRLHAEVAPLRRPGATGDAAEGGRGVRVVVSDTGIGIPREAIGKIFEPFFQVDSSATREYGGTGLGLAIVKSFVHAHGGSVWVESRPGKGSSFFFTLPLAP